MTDDARDCLICGSPGQLAYEARVDPTRLDLFSYSSRKVPELMHPEYRECQWCELLFAAELPQRGELLAQYQAAAFDAAIESRFAARSYLKALSPLIPGRVNSVLDVGCGDGEFLLACREAGINTLAGIEPSPAAGNLAREGIGKVIRTGGYEDQPTDQRYDLVTLFQTIEHIDDPIGFLGKTRELCHPGGYVAVACHNYQAPVNRVMGEKSPIFDIEHLQIFSTKSITRAMVKSGLEAVSVRPYSNTYPLSYWVKLAPIPASIKRTRLIVSGVPGRLPVRLPIGNLMALARVPGS